MGDCTHENFNCFANVGRLLREDGDKEAAAFVAEIKITCRDCGTKFEFLGVPMGYQPGATRVSVDGLELRAALRPKGKVMDQRGMVGFDIRMEGPR